MTSVLIQKHVLINGKWVERPYVLTRDGNGWHDTPADLTLDRYQERASQQAADRVRLKDESDEGWRYSEDRARAFAATGGSK